MNLQVSNVRKNVGTGALILGKRIVSQVVAWIWRDCESIPESVSVQLFGQIIDMNILLA